MKTSSPSPKPGAAFKAGAVSLAFFIVGYQCCLFVKKTAELAVQAHVDTPDTVFVYVTPKVVRTPEPPDTVVVRSPHRRPAAAAAAADRVRRVESFRFNPNTVSVEDLRRLGFSTAQAESIDSYRRKGGRFRRASDFARSYVVADSVYDRLEPYISIPRLDINAADSAQFDSLPGIGPYFASAMVSYRTRLGGYSCTSQLMEIYRFDSLKFESLRDLVCCSPPAEPFRLWTLPEDSLRLHPHIRTRAAARGIVLYRSTHPASECTVEGLLRAGILTDGQARSLSLCALAPPE